METDKLIDKLSPEKVNEKMRRALREDRPCLMIFFNDGDIHNLVKELSDKEVMSLLLSVTLERIKDFAKYNKTAAMLLGAQFTSKLANFFSEGLINDFDVKENVDKIH